MRVCVILTFQFVLLTSQHHDSRTIHHDVSGVAKHIIWSARVHKDEGGCKVNKCRSDREELQQNYRLIDLHYITLPV